ncbi:MAG: DUF4870 domain-containing protein [Acidimicrobiia bacterium]
MTTPPPPEYYPPSGDNLIHPMNDDDKTMGMIAHGGAIFVGFWAPLLIMLIKKDSAFAQQEAKEALNFQIIKFIALTVSGFLLFVLIGCVLLPVVLIGALIFEIIATMKVNQGEPYRYPINIRIIK